MDQSLQAIQALIIKEALKDTNGDSENAREQVIQAAISLAMVGYVCTDAVLGSDTCTFISEDTMIHYHWSDQTTYHVLRNTEESVCIHFAGLGLRHERV